MGENNLIQRLVWNFELSPNKFLSLNEIPTYDPEDLKWETRLFWPQDQIITLHKIEPELQYLTNYTHKNKEDCYYLLPKTDHNIKLRRGQLLYKPIAQHHSLATGFAAKINLDESSDTQLQKLRQRIKKEGIAIPVTKESFTYKFATNPAIKLELGRLEVKGALYYSLCVEGKSLQLVKSISSLLLGEYVSCDYVSFLKRVGAHD